MKLLYRVVYGERERERELLLLVYNSSCITALYVWKTILAVIVCM